MEDEGFEVEWGIEAEGKLWRKTLRKGQVPAMIWESNRTSTLQHLVVQLSEEVFCEGSARRDAGEVGHVNSDGGIRI